MFITLSASVSLSIILIRDDEPIGEVNSELNAGDTKRDTQKRNLSNVNDTSLVYLKFFALICHIANL